MKTKFLQMMRMAVLITLIAFIISCNNSSATLDTKQLSGVTDSVKQMAASLAEDVSRQGPVAWLHYFKDTSCFFMASEGQLVFPDYDSARNFINGVLVKNIQKIELQWTNVRIEPLSGKLASLAATFHENIVDFSGKQMPEDGYFTGIAQQTSQGWKLLNAHWSMIAAH